VAKRFALFLVLSLFAVAGGAFAACGDDDENSGTQQAGSPEPGDGVPTIDQDDLRFKPDELTVSVGQTIRFMNSETALHTVTIDGDNVSGNMREDDVFEWTPEQAGEYEVTCDYHPQMKAKIIVE
jgi:plastocyanin